MGDLRQFERAILAGSCGMKATAMTKSAPIMCARLSPNTPELEQCTKGCVLQFVPVPNRRRTGANRRTLQVTR